jgi:hypothetical protein
MTASMLEVCANWWKWSRDGAISFSGVGMNSLVRAKSVRFDEDSFWVELSDGRTLSVPLAWFPRLLRGSPEQREAVSISSRGLHWDELNEDISIEGLLAGKSDQTRPRTKVDVA